MVNGALFSEYKFTTVNTPYILTINQPIAPHMYPFKGKFDLTFKPKSNFGYCEDPILDTKPNEHVWSENVEGHC